MMKKNLLIIGFYLCLSCFLSAQEAITFLSDDVIHRECNTPQVREDVTGTKLVTHFSDNVPFDVQAAFTKACEILEEVLPDTYPIIISVDFDEDTEPSGKLSRVVCNTKPWPSGENTRSPLTDEYVYIPYSTTSQVKVVSYVENVVNKIGFDSYYLYIDNSLFNEDDISITYYNKYDQVMQNCSFHTDDVCEAGKYDFVSVAIRDIVRGLGVFWTQRPNRTIQPSEFIPFQNIVGDSLLVNGNTVSNVTQRATMGFLPITDYSGRQYNLYAPSQWAQFTSLCYFQPQTGNPLSRILSYDFGRETMIRDISGSDIGRHLCDMLYWYPSCNIAVGIGDGVTNIIGGNTEDALGDDGEIYMSAGVTMNSSHLIPSQGSGGGYPIQSLNESDSSYLYHPNYIGDSNLFHQGWSVSIMRKDGTWDLIYANDYGDLPLVIENIYSLLHDSEMDNYARTHDGMLRGRITNFLNQNLRTNYIFLSGCVPQKVKMQKGEVLPYTDEYIREVKIKLKDIEGVDRLYVAQLDEWDYAPVVYEVTDFSKGYFVATVDKEFSSEFHITAYKGNKYTVSDSFVLQPLDPPTTNQLQVSVSDNRLVFSWKNDRLRRPAQSAHYYEIYEISHTLRNKVAEGTVVDGVVDISTLKSGFYVLRVSDDTGNKSNIKFRKS